MTPAGSLGKNVDFDLEPLEGKQHPRPGLKADSSEVIWGHI